MKTLRIYNGDCKAFSANCRYWRNATSVCFNTSARWGVKDIALFVKGKLSSAEAEVVVVHAAVVAMKGIKPRADFEVYLNKFLQSLNLILPNAAGHTYRSPARRFGYLLRMIKSVTKTNRPTSRMPVRRLRRSSTNI